MRPDKCGSTRETPVPVIPEPLRVRLISSELNLRILGDFFFFEEDVFLHFLQEKIEF